MSRPSRCQGTVCLCSYPDPRSTCAHMSGISFLGSSRGSRRRSSRGRASIMVHGLPGSVTRSVCFICGLAWPASTRAAVGVGEEVHTARLKKRARPLGHGGFQCKASGALQSTSQSNYTGRVGRDTQLFPLNQSLHYTTQDYATDTQLRLVGTTFNLGNVSTHLFFSLTCSIP